MIVSVEEQKEKIQALTRLFIQENPDLFPEDPILTAANEKGINVAQNTQLLKGAASTIMKKLGILDEEDEGQLMAEIDQMAKSETWGNVLGSFALTKLFELILPLGLQYLETKFGGSKSD